LLRSRPNTSAKMNDEADAGARNDWELNNKLMMQEFQYHTILKDHQRDINHDVCGQAYSGCNIITLVGIF